MRDAAARRIEQSLGDDDGTGELVNDLELGDEDEGTTGGAWRKMMLDDGWTMDEEGELRVEMSDETDETDEDQREM